MSGPAETTAKEVRDGSLNQGTSIVLTVKINTKYN